MKNIKLLKDLIFAIFIKVIDAISSKNKQNQQIKDKDC